MNNYNNNIFTKSGFSDNLFTLPFSHNSSNKSSVLNQRNKGQNSRRVLNQKVSTQRRILPRFKERVPQDFSKNIESFINKSPQVNANSRSNRNNRKAIYGSNLNQKIPRVGSTSDRANKEQRSSSLNTPRKSLNRNGDYNINKAEDSYYLGSGFSNWGSTSLNKANFGSKNLKLSSSRKNISPSKSLKTNRLLISHFDNNVSQKSQGSSNSLKNPLRDNQFARPRSVLGRSESLNSNRRGTTLDYSFSTKKDYAYDNRQINRRDHIRPTNNLRAPSNLRDTPRSSLGSYRDNYRDNNYKNTATIYTNSGRNDNYLYSFLKDNKSYRNNGGLKNDRPSPIPRVTSNAIRPGNRLTSTSPTEKYFHQMSKKMKQFDYMEENQQRLLPQKPKEIPLARLKETLRPTTSSYNLRDNNRYR
ncbi:hypothetical protein ABSA28_00709 [Candidatus Hepatincolaceae symbiont of Richtersius coronifer]